MQKYNVNTMKFMVLGVQFLKPSLISLHVVAIDDFLILAFNISGQLIVPLARLNYFMMSQCKI